MKKYHIGCSGFYYSDWVGKFYPEDLNKKKWLEFYAGRFDTVEINNSFYRLPKETTVEGWYDRTPEKFLFTLKGSRYITHVKRLIGARESIAHFYHLADILKEKMGSILWQLPPNLKIDKERLINFCKALSTNYKNVIEFRHASWFHKEIYEILREYKIAYCIISAPGNLPEDIITTTNFAYLRFHGKTDWYNYHYSKKQLNYWKNRIERLKVKEVFIYFNNDHNTQAVENGLLLKKLLKKEEEHA
ncbi:DUF72 domain-containing protein [Fulvivirga sp. 29W222]|uniref:DUF72 domain-containing protein n=1 Tax=Fulvivirga marina TaxID=2494733 RepID=A0A937G249_9BACT|nr:DUF72 domain-containing protein [Fulvivirga marina]MBL6449247.1 DUF72 domain-containing protein [Fulvivirga marina]